MIYLLIIIVCLLSTVLFWKIISLRREKAKYTPQARREDNFKFVPSDITIVRKDLISKSRKIYKRRVDNPQRPGKHWLRFMRSGNTWYKKFYSHE